MKSVVASPARVAVLAMVLLLSACSVLQMVYSQAPRYVQWRSNVAHHFNAEQYSLVKAVVHRWFAWHRQDQMPRVAVLLALAADDVRGPVSPALACERRQAYLALAKQGLARAAPLAAAVMVRLGPEQLARVQTFYTDINDDFRDDYLADDPREQAELAADFMLKWGSWVYGDFSDGQRQRLVAEVMALPFSARTVLDEFQRFQRQYVQLLRDIQTQGVMAEQASQRLQAMVLDGIDPQDPVRKAQMQRWVQAGCAFASWFQGQTTDEQRAHAARTLSGWQADVVEIASSQ